MKRNQAKRVANWASLALTCLLVGACFALPTRGDADTQAFVEVYRGIGALFAAPLVLVTARWLVLNNIDIEN